MNICMFTNTYLPHVGGVARSIFTFAEDLCKLNQQVLIVAPEFDPPGIDPGPMEVLRVPAIQNFNGSDFSVRIPLPFIINERLKDFGPDIIHSHHPYLLGDAALRAARQHSRPLVFTHHTLYENYTHYVPIDSDGMRRFAIRLSAEYANLCDHVIAPSASISRLIRRRGVIRPVSEIPTGVDLEVLGGGRREKFRHENGLSDSHFVFGHVGRLAPEKNIPFLAEALALAMQNHPDTRFLIVGDGPSQDVVSEKFERRGVSNRLMAVGKLTGPDLADAYRAMDLFVFASVTETQGLVLAEAMAAGLPVAALDASGVREVVRDGRNGKLLPADISPEGFARAILELAQDHRSWQAMSEHARRTARRFARDACARSLLEIYERLAAEHTVPALNNHDEMYYWTTLLNRIRAEWELLTEKATAAIDSISSNEDPGTDFE